MALHLLRCAVVFLAGAPLAAQSVHVYSEFQRLDPQGKILAVDRAPRPREILSPAVIRNAYASFQVAVTAPEGVQCRLYLGQNPENTVKPTIYKVVYERRGTAAWPDRLEALQTDEDGLVADPGPRLPGQTAHTYWLDLLVPAQTPVGRMRFELQLNVGNEWVIYPMEIRVTDPVLGLVAHPIAPLAPVDASADSTARETLRHHLCGTGKREVEGPLTIRRLIRRNVRQDMALAASLNRKCDKAELTAGLLKILAAGGELSSWCQAPAYPAGQGAEWYLRVRDYLYRAADSGCAAADPELKGAVTIAPVEKQR